jgi:hypothetical protein
MNETRSITLDTPIVRGETGIASVAIRKPRAGELRGVTLTDLLQMDVTALTRVLPRITEPALTEHEVSGMDPADLTQMGTAVAGFLLPRAALASAAPASPYPIQ